MKKYEGIIIDIIMLDYDVITSSKIEDETNEAMVDYNELM